MALSPPTRIDDDVYADARATAAAMSRSVAQQISHWARLGRALEVGGIATVDAAKVLDGSRAYDEISGPAQAMVRTAWAEQIDAAIDALDLPGEFAADGRGWVEADADGNVIEHPPGS
jgi:hypothetical protein